MHDQRAAVLNQVGLLSFDLTEAEQEELMQNGRDAAMAYLLRTHFFRSI